MFPPFILQIRARSMDDCLRGSHVFLDLFQKPFETLFVTLRLLRDTKFFSTKFVSTTIRDLRNYYFFFFIIMS